MKKNGAEIERSKIQRCLPQASIGSTLIILVLFAMMQVSLATRGHYSDSAGYDPEQQDGIPVFSARSVSRPLEDEWASEPTQRGAARPISQRAQRRQADADLDDGMEEEDDDEYKSGSSPQESIENPSYGESGRASRDGDEIENFFDKHLGPPQDTDVAEESAISAAHKQVPAVDLDDQYEAAASSPLSSIFHSLLGHSQDGKSKRPFLQIGTVETDHTPSSDETKDSRPTSSLKASQSAQSYVEAAPAHMALAPLVGAHSTEHSVEEVDPPQVSADSGGVREIYIGRRPTVMSYLQQSHAQQHNQRPTGLVGYTTAGSSNVWRAGAPNDRQAIYEQQEQAAIDYARHPIAASHAYQREQQAPPVDEEQTVTYGLSFGAAPSARDAAVEQSVEMPESGGGDEQASMNNGEQQQHQLQQAQEYVPYNTRYSTSSTRAHNNYYNNQPSGAPQYRGHAVAAADNYARSYQASQQPQRQLYYMPLQQMQYRPSPSTRYHRDPSESPGREATAVDTSAGPAGARAQRQQYAEHYYRATHGRQRGEPNGAAPIASLPQTSEQQEQQQEQQQQEEQQHQRHYDDDEAYAATQRSQASRLEQRQRLLASLDREIKASPIYRARGSTGTAVAGSARTQMYAARPQMNSDGRHRSVAVKAVHKDYKDDQLDSFSSFHSEMDPYKSFTTTSHMVDVPTSAPDQVGGRYSTTGAPADAPTAADSSRSSSPSSTSRASAQNGTSDFGEPKPASNERQNLLTGPLVNYDSALPPIGSNNSSDPLRGRRNGITGADHDQVVNSSGEELSGGHGADAPSLRVRREDADEREIDNDADEDGVWVDDDEDDDNKQQSSDVNETSQEPEEAAEGEEDEGNQEDEASNVVPVGSVSPTNMNPPGVVGGPHGYELSPNDLMIYHG